MPNTFHYNKKIQNLVWISATLYLGLMPFAHITAIKELCFGLLILGTLAMHPVNALKTSNLSITFAVWITLALLSLAWSVQPEVTVKSIWRDAAKGMLAFYICYIAALKGLPRPKFLFVITLLSVIFSTLALYDFLVYQTWQGPHSPPRYDVSVSLLALTAVMFLNFESQDAKRGNTRSIIMWFAFALAFITGLLSASRSFVLALILGFILIATIYRTRFSLSRPGIIGRSALMLAVIALPLIIFSFLNSQRSLGHTQDRQILYSTVLENALKNPLTGTGFGHETNRHWYAETFPNIPGGEGLAAATHAHNVFLSYLEQLGLPGLLLALILFYSLARPCWRAAKSASPELKRLGCAGLLLILGTFISNTFNFYFARHHLLLFMGLCGVIHGWIYLATLPAAQTSDKELHQDPNPQHADFPPGQPGE